MSHGFQDYTVSSALERFIDGIERGVEALLMAGVKGRGSTQPVSVSVSHGLPFRNDAYSLTWLPLARSVGVSRPPMLPTAGGVGGWAMVSHEYKYHDWFLPRDCIVLEPESYSRRILNVEEYHTVLSAVAVALDNLVGRASPDHASARVVEASSRESGEAREAREASAWLVPPIYVPRHDARRDACGGVGKVLVWGDRARVWTQWFDCDSVHGRVGEASLWVGGLRRRLEMFAVRLGGVAGGRGHGVQRVQRVVEALDEEGLPVDEAFFWRHGVLCCTKRTFHVYRKVCFVGDDEGCGDFEGQAWAAGDPGRWDRRLPWGPWVALDDPIGGVEVDVVEVDGIDDAFETGDGTTFADAVARGCGKRSSVYRVYAMDADHELDAGNRPFLPLRVEDVSRKFLRCVDVEQLGEEAVRAFPGVAGVQSGWGGVAGRLHACLGWYRLLDEHERSVQGGIRLDDVLEDDWWVAHAEELAIDVEDGVSMTEAAEIVQNAVALTDAWNARGLSAADLVALHATTIPGSLRGALQVWKSFVNGYGGDAGSETKTPCIAMARMIVGLFRAGCELLSQSQSNIVRRQVDALRATSKGVLEEFQPICDFQTREADVDTDISHMYGISNVLMCVEHTAAAAASLRQRLDGVGADEQLHRLIDGMILNAMQERPNCGFTLREEDVEALVLADRGDAIGLDGPVSVEHLIEAFEGSDASPEPAAKETMPWHRMYVSRLPNEVRIATSILHV